MNIFMYRKRNHLWPEFITTESLPEEILLKIFDYVNPITKIICSRVSTRLLSICELSLSQETSIDLRETFLTLGLRFVTTSNCLQALIRKCPRIIQLTLDAKIESDAALLYESVRTWPKMTKLKLSSSGAGTFRQYEVLAHLKFITCIAIEASSMSVADKNSLCNVLSKSVSIWTNLERFGLSIPCTHSVSYEFAVALMTSLAKSVTYFQFRCKLGLPRQSSMDKVDNAIETFIRKHPNLISFELEIRNQRISNFDLSRTIDNLRKFCPNLEEIAFGRCSEAFANEHLSVCQNLKSLKFVHNETWLSNMEVNLINSVANQLETLSLSSALFVYPTAPPVFTNALVALKNLHITRFLKRHLNVDNETMPFISVKQFFGNLPNLEKISVPLELFTDQFLEFPIFGCLLLKKITCSTIFSTYETPLIEDCLENVDKLLTKRRQNNTVLWADKICIKLSIPHPNYYIMQRYSRRSYNQLYVVNVAK